MSSKVTGSYKANAGDWDGMHSFESRVSDGFGGKMHTKINEALKEFYTTKKLNPYVSSIKITMDKNNYTVNWEVTIDESPDGVAYVGITSRGGAGGADGSSGSINRAYNQIVEKKAALPSEVENSTISVDIFDFYFKFSNSGAVRQIFILYTSPSSYPNLAKSANLTNGKVGKPIGKNVGPETNGKLIQTSTVPPGTTNTVSVNNAAQTNTNPEASKITSPVDGTSIPTGGTFDFSEISDSNKNKIGFISFPPRRNGSVPVLVIYPRKENVTNDENFKLGKEEVVGKFSGIRMANKFLSWTNPQGQTADKNWIPDVTKAIGSLSKSPLESWFSKWCIVFANEPDTDFTQLTNQTTEQLESRSMTISSLNLTIFADSGYIDNSIIKSLLGTPPFPIKTLMLLEVYPSKEILEISKKIKTGAGQVYNVYDSQKFKTNITKNIVAGLSYSGPPFEETSTVSNSTTQSQLSNPILFFDSVTSATISATQYNSLFGTSASSYSPFPLIPYSSLPFSLIPGSSPSQFTQSTSVKFLNDLTFTYTTLPQDLLKEGAYVYDLSKDPLRNFTSIGASAGWPEVKLINGDYILTTPTVTPGPVVGGTGSTATPSTASSPIPEINVKYVVSHLQQRNIDDFPQLGFQIFYSDIEKIIGQSIQAGTPLPPKVLLSGQFTFDVRKKGYLINDQLGELKIIDKQEIDLFIGASEEVYEEGPSPEYVEEEFKGEAESIIAIIESDQEYDFTVDSYAKPDDTSSPTDNITTSSGDNKVTTQPVTTPTEVIKIDSLPAWSRKIAKIATTTGWEADAANFISLMEGFKDKATFDVNRYRMGFGSEKILKNGKLVSVNQGDTCTKDEAVKTLATWGVPEFSKQIQKDLGSDNWNKLTKYQKAAITSLGYNVGSGYIQARSYGKRIKEAISKGDIKAAAQEILNGPKTAKGKVLKGLVNRRKLEAQLFLLPESKSIY